jgi:predicted TIM-barrel fold metal-dependent hydrolase
MDLREHIFDAYNRHMAEVCAQAPGRLYFAGIPNYWDLDQSAASIRTLKALGASALMAPIHPNKDADGEPIHYNDPKMDRFWAAVEESGLPLCFHIGEKLPMGLPGAAAQHLLVERQGFRGIWAALTFSGVFDRFPDLRIVFAEAGIGWVPPMLHDADVIYTSFPPLMEPKLRHPPSWYWFHHCYATFQVEPGGLELMHRIGADRILWASDYPHPESTFGYTRTAVDAVLDAVGEEAARKIVGGNALTLFGMI